MDFSQLDGTDLSVAVVFLLLIAAQAWLVNRERAWLGAFVPATYFGILMFLGVTGRITSLVDFVFAALGLLGLLVWWISARETRRKKTEEFSGFPPLQAAGGTGNPSRRSKAGVRPGVLLRVA